MSMNSGFKIAAVLVIVATVVIAGGAAFAGVLYNPQSPNVEPTPTPTPTVTPTASPTATPTASPTPSPSRTARPTASPSPAPTASPTPSPSPTPEPVATAFQNATISYNEVNYTVSWVVNGTLADTNTAQGISGLTISVVDATNSSLVYGTTITGDNGYFEYTLDVMQPPTLQLIFAGNDQYIAVTSDSIGIPPT
ncbi:MAG: hypothetical protein M1490_02695 [Candidatus Bathyarchaeota archaeon]|nr:hypothetical protein [Candidatus Bathyarchaeota archaeon]